MRTSHSLRLYPQAQQVDIQCFLSNTSGCGCEPRYFVTDDSAIEQKAACRTFPECSQLPCTVHTKEDICPRGSMRNIPQDSSHAMYCLTRIECEDLCEQAIDAAPAGKLWRDIQTSWQWTAAEWASYDRQHNPLLQVITNPRDAWHCLLPVPGCQRDR
jgi:hypothetical protein